MFQQVTIIGLGLIGSSIARALKLHALTRTLVAADLSPEVLKAVEDLGFADRVTGDLAESVRGSDLVVLSVPVGAFGVVAQAIGPFLAPGAIVTDTGSVKRSVINQMSPHLPAHVNFVPAHPIAGTEHSGPRAGFPELFIGRWCILTPLSGVSPESVGKMTEMWKTFGARTETMTPEHHDMALGITSHLPHLIAYTIVGTASDLETQTRNDVIRFSASGFRDFTRIAASDPIMWRDIFLHNRDSVLSILQRFSEDLTALQRAIRDGNGPFLEETFARTRAIRRQIIDLGQADYVYPGKVSGEEAPPVMSMPDEERQIPEKVQQTGRSS